MSLVAVRWADIDLDSGDLTIRRSLVQVGDELIEKTTKTHASRRIRLDAETVDQLRGIRLDQEHAAGLASVTVLPKAYVFSPDPCGFAPWKPNSATQAFRRLAEQAGVDVSRLHSASPLRRHDNDRRWQ